MPYQIIHNIENFVKRCSDVDISILYKKKKTDKLEEVIRGSFQFLINIGINGIVTNVIGQDGYLENEEGFNIFLIGLKIAKSLNLKIWIYDEKGYPSGSAGGLVLRDNPECEAKGIKKEDNKYYIDTLYEHTHASNNYHEKRRYINLLDYKAVSKFIEVTHNKYKSMIPKELFNYIEAFFTDEPSLMSVVTEKIDNKEIKVFNKINPLIRALPSLPISEELILLLSKKYNVDLMDIAPKLFEYSNIPSPLKCMFWECVSLVYESSFSIQLSKKCAKMNKKLTGHILFEETPFLNMIFHSNPFRILKNFQIPGIDLLSNKSENISIYTHKLAYSCAYLTSKSGIMTETGDFFDRIDGVSFMTPEIKKRALFLQFVLGVRHFTYYYEFNKKPYDEYRKINIALENACSYVENGIYFPEVAIYCAYETIWSLYAPNTSSPFNLINDQPKGIQKFENEILELCNDLYKKNIQYIIFDESSINELNKKGIKKVILPLSNVVSKKLIDILEKNEIEIYGYQPKNTYLNGKIKKAKTLNIQSISKYKKRDVPFKSKNELIYSALENDVYIVYNPNESIKIEMELLKVCEVYNPFSNLTYIISDNKKYVLESGQIVIVKFDC